MRTLSCLKHLLVFECFDKFVSVFGAILEASGKFEARIFRRVLDQSLFFQNLKILIGKFNQGRITLGEFAVLKSMRQVGRFLKKMPGHPELEHFEADKLEELKGLYKKFSAKMGEIYNILKDKNVVKICQLRADAKRRGQQDISQLGPQIQESIWECPIAEFQERIGLYLDRVKRYKDLRYLSSKLYKKMFFFTCLLFDETEFINFFFTEEEFDDGRDYASDFEEAIYHDIILNMVFEATDHPPGRRSRSRLPKRLRNTKNYFFNVIEEALNRKGYINFTRVDYFFRESNLSEEGSALKKLFKRDEAMRARFQDVIEKYEHYRQIEDIIKYMRGFDEIFYSKVEPRFEDSKFFGDLRKLQVDSKRGVNSTRRSRRGLYYQIIRQLRAQNQEKFTFIREITTKFKGSADSQSSAPRSASTFWRNTTSPRPRRPSSCSRKSTTATRRSWARISASSTTS